MPLSANSGHCRLVARPAPPGASPGLACTAPPLRTSSRNGAQAQFVAVVSASLRLGPLRMAD